MLAVKNSLLSELEKEQELFVKVKLGESVEASQIFEELFSEASKTDRFNLPTLKARVLELLLRLSRTAVENGANFDAVVEINTKLIQDIAELNRTEELYWVAKQALRKYMKEIQENGPEHNQIVYMVKQFIRENYYRKLSLEEIAQAVFLSPYYVSHLFKDIEGTTIMDYLDNVRVEKAKQLLCNPKYKIYQVSQKLGFKDPSYFAKVFRRTEGKSPSQYRRRA